MWSRLSVPINRSLTHKSLIALHSPSIHPALVLQRHKHEATDKTTKQHPNDQKEKLQKNRNPFCEAPSQAPLLSKTHTDDFGHLNRTLEFKQDAGDIADEEYNRNIPLRRNQLSLERYQQMVNSFIRDKRLKEAIDVVEVRMKEDRVKPDYYLYDLLIMECGRRGYTKKAFKLYNQMKKRGLKVTGPTYAALFNACAKSIHPKEALDLANNLRKIIIQNGFAANEIVYNAMISAYGRCGEIDMAFQLVDEMKEKKLRLKIDTINHLLQACCSDTEYGFRHALFVWHRMFHKKLTPDIHTFNLMLRCTRDCSIGDINEMKIVIATLLKYSRQEAKLKTNKNEILLIDDKPTNPINSNECTEIIDKSTTSDVESQPQPQPQPKEVCDQMPNLLNRLPHLGSVVQLTMAESSVDRLMLLGGLDGFIAELEESKVRPNVKTFSQLLYSIPSTQAAEHELIEKMRYMRVRADIDFFNLLMKRRIIRKDHDGAKNILEMIQKVNLRPDIVTYGVMAMGCANRDQAREFQQQLTEKGIRLNNEILGALLKNAIHKSDYDYTIDVLDYAKDNDIKPSAKFAEMLSEFKNKRYRRLQKQPHEQELTKFNQFYKVYKKWKTQMGLVNLSPDDVDKLLNIHPWKQIKEPEGTGIEDVKNSKIRRLWKRQHTLEKLTPSRLERLSKKSETTTKQTVDEPL